MVSNKTTAASLVLATAAATGVLASTAPAPAAAANSVANIPLNIIQTIANMPAAQTAGAAKTADALEQGGNWWLYTPGNVLGYDQADIAKINGIMAWLMPVPEVAQAFANPINVTFEANFPMTADCTGAPAPCADSTYWTDYFKVMPWRLIQGVTYGTVANTIDPSITMPWSNSTQRIDVFGVARALWNTLTKDPEGFQGLPTAEQISSTYQRLGLATFNSLNPFVDGTYCLPCQIVVKGAPGSLARIPLFGNWYTVTDLGQQFTDDNWVGRPDGVAEAPDVDALSLWSKEGQERLWKDIDASIKKAASGDLIDVQEMWKSIETIATGFRTIVPTGEDLTGAGAAISRDFASLFDSVSSSFGPSTSFGPPSAGSALSRLGSAPTDVRTAPEPVTTLTTVTPEQTKTVAPVTPEPVKSVAPAVTPEPVTTVAPTSGADDESPAPSAGEAPAAKPSGSSHVSWKELSAQLAGKTQQAQDGAEQQETGSAGAQESSAPQAQESGAEQSAPAAGGAQADDSGASGAQAEQAGGDEGAPAGGDAGSGYSSHGDGYTVSESGGANGGSGSADETGGGATGSEDSGSSSSAGGDGAE